jgi:phosphonate transport system ATP-binding protein
VRAPASDDRPTSAAVRVKGLELTYPDGHRALDGVDLSVDAGEVVALVGANGSGKSTLLRCLVRLIEPTGGVVFIDGTDVTAAGRSALRRTRTRVGFVFQRFHLVPRLTAFQNVLHGAVGRHGPRCLWSLTAPNDVRDEAMECLRRVGLAHLAERRVDRLSGGQAQRVAIARMLLQQPRIILADEPVASLDPRAGLEVMDLLREVAAERDLTVIVALHQLDLALGWCERIVGLQSGRVALSRATDDCVRADLDALYQAAAV